MSITCPRCGLSSPDGSLRCDCGFRFEALPANIEFTEGEDAVGGIIVQEREILTGAVIADPPLNARGKLLCLGISVAAAAACGASAYAGLGLFAWTAIHGSDTAALAFLVIALTAPGALALLVGRWSYKVARRKIAR